MIWLAILAPLLGAFLNGIILRKINKKYSYSIASSSALISFLASIKVFTNLLQAKEEKFYYTYSWISVSNLQVPFELVVDQISGLMLIVITGIATLVQIYAIGYMNRENNTHRFFSYLSLFIFMMLLLVCSNNLLLMFFSWEGLGLCSYLLIGYWYKKKENLQASLLAFTINKIGSLAFLLGIILTFDTFHSISFSELPEIINKTLLLHDKAQRIGLITLFFFIGICGKSAQLPFLTWLPDSMQAPAPVSALIHSVTMLTAGVYVMIRMNFLFYLAPNTMLIISLVGTCTALYGATIALVQTDIKKILAYSTISQFGNILLACSIGAFNTGIFHLLTHACFKTLLVLSTGSIIFALPNKKNMFEIGIFQKKNAHYL